MEIGFHVLEDHIEILATLNSPNDLEELDDVGVFGDLLEEDDLAEGSLGICLVVERVEDLLGRRGVLF